MENEISKLRKNIFFGISILILLFIIIKYMGIMLFDSSNSGNSLKNKSTVERGPILDRNGKILAIQTRLYSVTAWVPSIKNIEKTVSILSDILNIDKTKLLKDISSRPRFMYVKRKISTSEADLLKPYIDKGELPGIGLEPEYGRSYPGKDIASHIIGYAGTDNIGLEGIEYTYNSVLSPPLKSGTEENITTYGNQVFLTIDLNIQNFAHQAALDAYEKYEPEFVVLIVAEAKTGDILGYVSIPEIDLNNFTSASELGKINHPIASAYEPGSVFKVFSIASLLQIGGIDESSTFYCNGYFEMNPDGVNPIRIRCLGKHGIVNAEKIVEYS
jgi:cell division protein FtsI (penicillin-binding protein 3)